MMPIKISPVMPFDHDGVKYRDVRTMEPLQRARITHYQMRMVGMIPPELQCFTSDRPLSSDPDNNARQRSAFDLGLEDFLGDVFPITMGALRGKAIDPHKPHRVRDAFGLFALRIHGISETKIQLTGRLLPGMQKYLSMNGEDAWAAKICDLYQSLVSNTFTLHDGMELEFVAIEQAFFVFSGAKKTLGDRIVLALQEEARSRLDPSAQHHYRLRSRTHTGNGVWTMLRVRDRNRDNTPVG
jgi:hypothetical protein